MYCCRVELWSQKIFFTIIYRSPENNANSVEFKQFLGNFENLHRKINSEKPYATFYTGDFNGHSQFWWEQGKTTPEGKEIEALFTSLNLSQVISEPTNFEPDKNPSCIDLLVTDQPNLILDSGTRPSLDDKCHHQIIYGKVNFQIPPPPPFERKIWHFNQANINLIQRSMRSFPWEEQFSLNSDPNWQVKVFSDTILNIMSNFIPNSVKRFTPRDPPWVTKDLKIMLKRKNRLFKNYKKRCYKVDDKNRLELFRNECRKLSSLLKLCIFLI